MAERDPRPSLAITLGDVAGIGPEVIARAWTEPAVHACCRAVVVGHPEVVRRAVELVRSSEPKRPAVEVAEVQSPAELASTARLIPCLATGADQVLDGMAAGGQIGHLKSAT